MPTLTNIRERIEYAFVAHSGEPFEVPPPPGFDPTHKDHVFNRKMKP